MISWPLVTLAQVCEKPQYGAIAKGSDVPIGPRFVRQTDITSGRIDWSSVPFCDLPPSDFDKFAILPGDVLISRLGNGVGNAATVYDTKGAVFAGYLVRFQARASKADPAFIGYQLQSDAWRQHVSGFRSGAAQPTLNAQQMGEFQFLFPPLHEQRGIAATLGALDDKIESNRRAYSLLRELGMARFEYVISRGNERRLPLSDVSISIARGIVPNYADDDPLAPLVLNQRCVRDGRISLGPARRMVDRQVAIAKKASSGDILVNSTGTGTLGRVGRWHKGSIFVDGHVSVVKPNSNVVPSTVLAYALFGREMDIEGLATGSTGQTELSPTMLGSLKVALPSVDFATELEGDLFALERRSVQLEHEMLLLGQLRDALLPELLSGRIRVSEAVA